MTIGRHTTAAGTRALALITASAFLAVTPAAQTGAEATTFRIGGGETIAAEHGTLTVPANRQRVDAGSLRDRLRQCVSQLTARGVEVRGLTTEESADDVEALRAALGAPQVTLLAGSYGTHLALAAARRHPTRVARMALLGVEGPDHTVKLPAAVDAVIRDIDTMHPGTATAILELRARLRDAPWARTLPNGQPVTVGEWDLQRRVADALATTRDIEALVAALPVMMSGDFSDLVRWAIPYRSARPMNVMNIAMDCASFGSANRLAAVREQEPASLLGNAMNFPLPDLCQVEGLPRLGDDFRTALVSDVPTLLVSGTWDGRTPPANAEDVARTMSRAHLVVIPRASHGLFQEGAATAALRMFLGRQ
jgi:pimeloyl-ACP methyl ester carboxylesterase